MSSTPELLREKIVLSEDKLDDINSLLKNRFGEDWKSLTKLKYFHKFYKKGGTKSVSGRNVIKGEEVDESDEECTCCGEDEPTYLQ